MHLDEALVMKPPPKRKAKGARKGPPAKVKKGPPKRKKAPPSGKGLTPEQEMLARGMRPNKHRQRSPPNEPMHTGTGEAITVEE